MDKYKVFGDKLHQYYTVISAPSPEAAWDIASNRDDLSWFEVETDAVIEPYEVELVEDEVKVETNQLEDGWPSMENPIINK